MRINLIPESRREYRVQPVCPSAKVENSLRQNSQNPNNPKPDRHYRRIPVLDYDTVEIQGVVVQISSAMHVPKEGGSDTFA